MPVLGTPELCTNGAHSNSMGDNAERRFPLHRLDVAATTPRKFEASYVHMQQLLSASVKSQVNSPSL